MSISFNCPHCKQLFAVPDNLAHTKAACSQCGEVIAVPGPATAVPQGIPVAVPVAAAVSVGVPVAVPVATPVATPVGDSVAVPVAMPVRSAAEKESVRAAPSLHPLDDVLAGGAVSTSRMVHRRKKPSPIPAIIIGAGMALTTLIAVILMIRALRSDDDGATSPGMPQIALAPPVPIPTPSAPVTSPLVGLPATALAPKEAPPIPVPVETAAPIIPETPTSPSFVPQPPGLPFVPQAPGSTPSVRPTPNPEPFRPLPAGPQASLPRPTRPWPPFAAPGHPQRDPLAGPAPPGFQPISDGAMRPADVLWKVQPDPSATLIEADPKRKIVFRLPPGGFSNELLFADGAGPFLAIGGNKDPKDVREFWDFTTKVKKGTLTGVTLSWVDRKALSPDGQYFAAVAGRGAFSSNNIVVYTVKTGKPLGQLSPPDATRFGISWLAFAGPDVLAFKFDNMLRLSRLPGGELIRDIDVGLHLGERQLEFSPGGKYLAISANRSIKFLSTETGDLMGELSFPPEVSQSSTTLTFSPDGSELAALFDNKKGHLYVFNLADGSVASRIDLEEPLSEELRTGLGYKGQILDWFPDKSGWLAYGRGIVDREAGLVFRLPDTGFDSSYPRKVLDKGRLLTVGGTKERPELVTFDLPQAAIEKATAVVQAGGEVGDADLPPLTAVNLNDAEAMSIHGLADWSVKADPAPLADKAFPGKLELKGKTGTLRGLYLSRADVGEAIVWYTLEDRPFGRHPFNRARNTPVDPKQKPTWADRYHLATGRRISTIEIPFHSEVVGLSPDGTRLVTRSGGTGERLDVWDAATEKHVVGFRPYSKLANYDRAVTAVAFLDSTRLLTLSHRSTLVLWSLPDCKPIYRMENVSQPGISPGGKYLLLTVGDKIRFFEAATGAPAGDLNASRHATFAFHPDGVRFAALVNDYTDSKCVEWDLTTGEQTAEGMIPPAWHGSLQWAGDGYLLFDNRYLYDTKQQKVAWRYKQGRFTSHSPDSPDGRHWYLSQRAARDPAVTLFAQALPDPNLKKWLDNSVLPDETVLAPGSRVNLQITVGGTADRPALPDEIRKNITAQLEQRGAVLAADGDLVMTISAAMMSEGKTQEYRTFGASGGPPLFTLNVTSLTCSVALSQQGKKVWETTSNFSAGKSSMEIIERGEDPNAQMAKRQWQQAGEYLANLKLPRKLFITGAGQGIGESVLGYGD